MNLVKRYHRVLQSDDGGFTLIEILIGITIFSVIASSIYLTFFNGMRIERQSREASALYGESRWLISALEMDLENAVAYQYRKEGSDKDFNAFQGTDKSLSLIIPTATGLKGVRYYLQLPETSHIYGTVIGRTTKKNINIKTVEIQGVRTKFLVREEIPFYKLINNIAADYEEIEIMCQNVQDDSLEFSYGVPGDELQTKIVWKSEWAEPHLPAGVRMKLAIINSKNEKEILPIERDFMVPTGYFMKK